MKKIIWALLNIVIFWQLGGAGTELIKGMVPMTVTHQVSKPYGPIIQPGTAQGIYRNHTLNNAGLFEPKFG